MTAMTLIPVSELFNGSDPRDSDGDGEGVDGSGGRKAKSDGFRLEPEPEEVEDACEVPLDQKPSVVAE